jgi:hypothetical protein
MGTLAQPLTVKLRASSKFTLATSAFDVVNYRSGTNTPGLPPNLTMTTDTPTGVLSGSVAAISTANPSEVTSASYNTPVGGVLGLFVTGAAGNPFENNQAAAGGVISIYMGDGELIVYNFETNTSEVGYASILSSYTLGCLLYVSPFGLLSPLQPSALTSVYTTTPHNNVVGSCWKVPTATDLSLGIRLFGAPATVAAYT